MHFKNDRHGTVINICIIPNALFSGHKMAISGEKFMRRNAKITKDYIYLCSVLRVLM
jgi:hypothetical protein